MDRRAEREPRKKPCFLCEHEFLAEWARARRDAPWQTSEICEDCERRLREKAA